MEQGGQVKTMGNGAFLPYFSFVIAVGAVIAVFLYAPMAAALGLTGIIVSRIAGTADRNHTYSAICRAALVVSTLAFVAAAVYLLLLLSTSTTGPVT